MTKNRPAFGRTEKRVGLAKVLISNPDFLILDEPTNHLDIEMTEWLEEYLGKSNATLLMVTHDRYFLDRVCNQIIEIDKFGLFSYSGNYAYYLEKERNGSKTAMPPSTRPVTCYVPNRNGCAGCLRPVVIKHNTG